MVRLILSIPLLRSLFTLLLARRVVVRGWSMAPTLLPGEYVLIDRLIYRTETPRQGDVVLAAFQHGRGVRLLKRVAATPGQEVRCDETGCWIDEHLYSPTTAPIAPGLPVRRWKLSTEEYFLLGDALDQSTDSRDFGPLPRRAILGRAWLVYWPLGRFRNVPHGSGLA